MQRQDYRLQLRGSGFKFRLRDRLIYLPGALVLAYGFWLVLID